MDQCLSAGLYDITNETLGKGHFAVVKLAKHCLTGEFVAVKVIDKAKLNNGGLHQLGLEIRVLSKLSEHQHTNIVKLYQVIDTKTKLYLVMEYCGRDVCDLFDYIQKRNSGAGLKEKEARHLFKQICSAIAYCHSLRIVHRDLKPENILIVTQNAENEETTNPAVTIYPTVKLIDFGFSNQWDEGQKLRTSCGSLAYSAPEILLGNRYDGDKVDIWGLGCILYILLYGNNPFMQINDSETLIRILDCTFSTPSRPNISDSAIALINSLLKKDPSSRLTVTQILESAWLQGNSAAPTTTTITKPEEESVQEEEEDHQQQQQQANSSQAPSSSSTNETPSKSSTSSVHDRVIEQMIAQKMCVSRDQVEVALKTTRDLTANTKPCNGQGNEAVTNGGSGDRDNSGSNNDNYISATYHLLKDKLVREMQGYVQTSSNVHEIQRNVHQKRSGHVLRQRAQRAPRFTPRFTPLSRSSPTDLDSMSPQPELIESDEPFALPLQRKCSIVSEEGSCTGADLSGHGSEGGSDVHTFLLADENENGAVTAVRRSHPTVNIVVTDYSTNEELKDDEIPLEEMELNEVESELLSDLEEDRQDDEAPEDNTTKLDSKLNANITCIHQVSSSPDFSRVLDDEPLSKEASDAVRFAIPQEAPATTASTNPNKNRRPVTMFLASSDQESPSQPVNDIEKHMPALKKKQSGGADLLTDSHGTKMRVIMASKSCNDIVLNNESDKCMDESGKGRKGLGSGCGQLIKRNKGDRTDCCTIC